MPDIQQQAIDQFNEMFGEEDLHLDLAPHVSKGRSFPILSHPLVIHVPYSKEMNKWINKQYAQKQASLAKAIEKKNWSSFVFIHERPYRIDALEEVLFNYEAEDPETVWDLIGHVWIDSENIYQALDRWKDIWELNVPKRARWVMDPTERKTFNALPREMTIYRGIAHRQAAEGMSWTLDRDRAIWFAKRFASENRTPMLATGTVRQKDVLAHFLGRNEQEIVAHPEDVTIQTVENL
jgi:hypothetical protein